MVKKESSIAEMARKNLIEAFFLIYENKSLRKISIREITDAAGYHRSTFYRYFSDEYELLERAVDELATSIAQQSDARMTGSERENSRMFFASLYNQNDKNLRLLMRHDEETGFSSVLKQKVREVMEENFVFSENEKENYYILEYKICGSIDTLVRYFKNDMDMPSEEFVDILMRLTDSGEWPLKTRKQT